MGWDRTELNLTVRKAFFHSVLPMDGLAGLEGVLGGLPNPIRVEDPMDMAGESSGDEGPVSEGRRRPIPEDAIFPSSGGTAIGIPFSMSLDFSPSLDIILFVIDLTLRSFVPALDVTADAHLEDRRRPRITKAIPGSLRKLSFSSTRTSPSHFVPRW